MDHRTTNLIVDGHVHVYSNVSIETVLECARRNFSALTDSLEHHDTLSVLFVADPSGVHGFDRIASANDPNSPEACASWVQLNRDDCHVSLQHSTGDTIVAVKGQQLITSEGLEVLGIGYGAHVECGLSLSKTVETIRSNGGRAVLAWGAGKWLGRRGRLVTDLIVAEADSKDIMLVDNGGRPSLWSHVRQFDIAGERGVAILAGSDPLPIEGDERRIGSYCFVGRTNNDTSESHMQMIEELLSRPRSPYQTLGRRMSVRRFVSNQVRLRLRAAS